MSDPACDGCGKRPEVYGSAWCASCHASLPPYAKHRILKLRNSLITIAYGRLEKMKMRLAAVEALKHPDPKAIG